MIAPYRKHEMALGVLLIYYKMAWRPLSIFFNLQRMVAWIKLSEFRIEIKLYQTIGLKNTYLNSYYGKHAWLNIGMTNWYLHTLYINWAISIFNPLQFFWFDNVCSLSLFLNKIILIKKIRQASRIQIITKKTSKPRDACSPPLPSFC